MAPLAKSGGSIPRQPANQLAAAYAKGQQTRNPRITSSAVSTRIIHREMVMKVAMTVNFTVSKISINPGLAQSFPWLSRQAVSWETYRFNSLRYCYYTRVGSATGGSVILAPDYDAKDSNPASEMDASSYVGCAEDVSWKDITCTLRSEGMHALGPKKYTRQGSVQANEDIKTYDVGSLFVCTLDGVAGPAGNLWVEYDITLTNPQIPPGGLGAPYQRIIGAAITSASPLGPSPQMTGTATFATIAGQVLTFTSAGRFNVDLWVNTSTSATMAASAVGGGGTVVDYGQPTGSGSIRLQDVVVVDAVVGTTITYPVTIVNGLGADLTIIPIQLAAPF